MDKNGVLNKLDALPLTAQRQVLDFITFLQTRYKPEETTDVAKRKEITNESFVGIWKNREDMEDSSGWVRSTRKTEWGIVHEQSRRHNSRNGDIFGGGVGFKKSKRLSFY